jgi:4-hydroxy 2-oxovalerate aldolase
MKFLSEKDKYKGLTKPIILPKHRFNNLELDMLKGNELIDYGMAIESEKMVIHSSSCIVPLDLTTAYALALALNSGARLITAIGFDGYDADDVRHSEMIQVLSQYKKLNLEVELIALTPSTYPIEQGSIYAHIR